jgi:hypothetical protein
VNASDCGGDAERAKIIASGRLLMCEHTGNGANLLSKAIKRDNANDYTPTLNSMQYNELNEKFQQKMLMFAAKRPAASDGSEPPADYEAFRRNSMSYYGDSIFYRVLQGIVREVVAPILPTTYSEAVGVFANTVEVGIGETYQLDIGSNDIPVFQDSSWGALRSVPENRLYDKSYVLNPQPKTAKMGIKWSQLVGNKVDFGRFFASLAAGMYSKTMAMWNTVLLAASADTTLVPSSLAVTYSDANYITAAAKIAALNQTSITNVICFGGAIPLSRILPSQSIGSAQVNMDAALAVLLGLDRARMGYIGEHLGTRLMPLVDAIVPGTQNTAPTLILPNNRVWLMAANSYKPMTIAYNSGMPLNIEFDPMKTADMTMGVSVTIAIDVVATISAKIATVTPI